MKKMMIVLFVVLAVFALPTFGQCVNTRVLDKKVADDTDWINLKKGREIVTLFKEGVPLLEKAVAYLDEKIKEGDPNKIYRFRNDVARMLHAQKLEIGSAKNFLPYLKCEAGELLRSEKISEKKYDEVMVTVKEMETITKTTFPEVENKLKDTEEKD